VQSRVGDLDEDPLVERVLSSVASRRIRLERVRSQIEELEAEAAWLIDEINGREQSLELLIEDLLRRVGRMFDDAWSPVPVLGFRMWTMQPFGLHGAKVTWRLPEMQAECLTTGGRDGVPHSDGRCGRLGCGVYATKELGPLVGAHLHQQSHSYAVGLVALSGKVVEHEFGYRAERAEIVALVAVAHGMYLATSQPAALVGICRTPARYVNEHGHTKPFRMIPHLEEYLSKYRERRSKWTSASSAG
jgi:hypothetical protein